MFGSKRKLDDLMAQLRPDLSREALGVGPAFPGVAPNPVLSGDARKRNAETLPVRYRPDVMDHYVALARDANPPWCSSSRTRSRDASGADPIARTARHGTARLATIAIRSSGTTQPASAGRSTGRPLAAHSEMPPVTFTAS